MAMKRRRPGLAELAQQQTVHVPISPQKSSDTVMMTREDQALEESTTMLENKRESDRIELHRARASLNVLTKGLSGPKQMTEKLLEHVPKIKLPTEKAFVKQTENDEQRQQRIAQQARADLERQMNEMPGIPAAVSIETRRMQMTTAATLDRILSMNDMAEDINTQFVHTADDVMHTLREYALKYEEPSILVCNLAIKCMEQRAAGLELVMNRLFQIDIENFLGGLAIDANTVGEKQSEILKRFTETLEADDQNLQYAWEIIDHSQRKKRLAQIQVSEDDVGPDPMQLDEKILQFIDNRPVSSFQELYRQTDANIVRIKQHKNYHRLSQSPAKRARTTPRRKTFSEYINSGMEHGDTTEYVSRYMFDDTFGSSAGAYYETNIERLLKIVKDAADEEKRGVTPTYPLHMLQLIAQTLQDEPMYIFFHKYLYRNNLFLNTLESVHYQHGMLHNIAAITRNAYTRKHILRQCFEEAKELSKLDDTEKRCRRLAREALYFRGLALRHIDDQYAGTTSHASTGGAFRTFAVSDKRYASCHDLKTGKPLPQHMVPGVPKTTNLSHLQGVVNPQDRDAVREMIDMMANLAKVMCDEQETADSAKNIESHMEMMLDAAKMQYQEEKTSMDLCRLSLEENESRRVHTKMMRLVTIDTIMMIIVEHGMTQIMQETRPGQILYGQSTTTADKRVNDIAVNAHFYSLWGRMMDVCGEARGRFKNAIVPSIKSLVRKLRDTNHDFDQLCKYIFDEANKYTISVQETSVDDQTGTISCPITKFRCTVNLPTSLSAHKKYYMNQAGKLRGAAIEDVPVIHASEFCYVAVYERAQGYVLSEHRRKAGADRIIRVHKSVVGLLNTLNELYHPEQHVIRRAEEAYLDHIHMRDLAAISQSYTSSETGVMTRDADAIDALNSARNADGAGSMSSGGTTYTKDGLEFLRDMRDPKAKERYEERKQQMRRERAAQVSDYQHWLSFFKDESPEAYAILSNIVQYYNKTVNTVVCELNQLCNSQ